jgi:hypothetical protein
MIPLTLRTIFPHLGGPWQWRLRLCVYLDQLGHAEYKSIFVDEARKEKVLKVNTLPYVWVSSLISTRKICDAWQWLVSYVKMSLCLIKYDAMKM